jgi:hypothetical protein
MDVVVGLRRAKRDALAVRRQAHFTQIVGQQISQWLRAAVHVHDDEAALGQLVADRGIDQRPRFGDRRLHGSRVRRDRHALDDGNGRTDHLSACEIEWRDPDGFTAEKHQVS